MSAPLRRACGVAAVLVPALVLAGGCTAPPAPPAAGSPAVTTSTASASASVTSTPTPSPTPTQPACTAEAAALSLPEQVGQLVMVGVGVPLAATQRTAITRYHLGSAIVMGATPGGVKGVAKLTSRLDDLADGTGMLVAADQEGGLVQRLRGAGFATIPSAARQAGLTDAELTRRATKWGRAMAKAGVRLNLAPVADVVPKANRSANRPIARLGRGYGSSPKTVSAKVAAFSAGMHAAGVGVAVKHFPGLGAVSGNTDFSTRVVDRTTGPSSTLLQPFRDAVADGAEAVMVSSAVYSRIDPDHPAVHSAEVIGLLREWGFDKVVVSDDLGAAAAMRSVPVAKRAVRFVRAGGDLVLTVDASKAGPMAKGLRAAAEDDDAFAAKVTAAAARVLALKASLGLYRCG